MLALALDSSSPATSCALVELQNGALRVLAEELVLPPRKAGDVLPEALLALCEKAGRSIDEVSALVAGLGPGSFTGLRVGLASAKGLAYARKWPLFGGSSLDALALHASRVLFGRQPGENEPRVVPALEARRGELFLSAGALHPAARVLRANEVAAFLTELAVPTLLVGPGAKQNRAALLAGGVPEAALAEAGRDLWPSAACLVELCSTALESARFDAAALFAIAPEYLAQSEPEKALAAGRVGKLPA